MTVCEMNIFQTLCFMYLYKNGNTPSIFKHIYTLKPVNKYTTRSKNILFKPLCKKNFAKFKLSYRGPHLWNKFIAPNNDLLEAVTIHLFNILLHFVYIAIISRLIKSCTEKSFALLSYQNKVYNLLWNLDLAKVLITFY